MPTIWIIFIVLWIVSGLTTTAIVSDHLGTCAKFHERIFLLSLFIVTGYVGVLIAISGVLEDQRKEIETLKELTK